MNLSLQLPMHLIAVVMTFISTIASATGRFEIEHKGSESCLILIEDELRTSVGTLVVLPRGTHLYHWGSAQEIETHHLQGKMIQEDLNARMARSSGNQGGGLYVSMDAWDSHSYGPKLMILDLEQDSFFIQTKKLYAIDDKFDSYLEIQKKLIEAGVHGTYYLSTLNDSFEDFRGDRWLNVFNEQATSKAREGTINDLLDETRGFLVRQFKNSSASTIEHLLKLNQRYPLKDSEWIQTNAPAISHLLNGQKLAPAEFEAVASSLSSAQKEDSSPLAEYLINNFHDVYVNLMKSSFEFVFKSQDQEGQLPSYLSMAIGQKSAIAKRLRVELSEVFTPEQLDLLRNSFSELEL